MRLRHARRAKKLRLKDVADRIGCSESLVSKIECGRTIPSLRTLHRIVTVLDTSIASLFDDRREVGVIVYRAGERPIVAIDEDRGPPPIRLERLIPYADGRALEGNIHVVAPGASNGGDIKHVGEEVGYVIEGEIELTVGSTTYGLKSGDSFFFPSELPHSYRNPGDRPTRVLWINTPPTF